jgi:hypothetical protein
VPHGLSRGLLSRPTKMVPATPGGGSLQFPGAAVRAGRHHIKRLSSQDVGSRVPRS